MSWKLLDDAVADALCPMFQAIVPVSSTVAVVGAFLGPKGWGASLVARSVEDLSMLGAAATCSEVEVGPDPTPDFGIGGCRDVENGYGTLQLQTRSGPWNDIVPFTTEIVSVSDPAPLGNQWIVRYRIKTVDNPNGQDRDNVFDNFTTAASALYRIDVVEGTCSRDVDTPTNPEVPDHIYTDPVTNCNYTVKFEGFIQETPDGPIQPVFQISGGGDARASGGRIGGCNLNPTIHVSPPNGPGGPGGPRIPPIPVPPVPPPGPGGGVPWWAAPLLSGATGAALNLIGRELAKLSVPPFEAGSFTMTAPCDVDEEGEPEFRTWEFEKGSFEQRMNAHQVALMEMLQQHLNWKTPTCRNDKPCLEGDWRTVSFRSDDTSPYGKSRLRKRFRYRSTSGYELGAVVDHWKDFTFTSGPVIVSHAGAPWGTPKVWAATADEGKRVIRHAAGEAGIDPDKTGRWIISGSSSARYGVSDTMRVDTTGGFYWISARDGTDARPLVAEVPHS